MRLFIGVFGFHILLAGGFLAFGNPIKGTFLLTTGLALLIYGFWPKRETENDDSANN